MKVKTKAQIFAAMFGVIFFTTIGMVIYNEKADDEDKIDENIITTLVVINAIFIGMVLLFILLGLVTIGLGAREVGREATQGAYTSRRPTSG